MANIAGLSSLRAKIDKELSKKKERLYIGLTRAGLELQAMSKVIVPVDYGNLKASSFVASPSTQFDNGNTMVVEVGYNAAYAIFVHENLEAAHGAVFNAKYAEEIAEAKRLRRKNAGGTTGPFRTPRGENQQAKFLEKPFRDNYRELLEIIMVNVRHT